VARLAFSRCSVKLVVMVFKRKEGPTDTSQIWS
jgi:hypothetical protein